MYEKIPERIFGALYTCHSTYKNIYTVCEVFTICKLYMWMYTFCFSMFVFLDEINNFYFCTPTWFSPFRNGRYPGIESRFSTWARKE